ncbi:FadR family transcriptional regulator [Candidatus Bipolaricaulota bacterium]|nr:FadR family transcriptional regulator [Candidatus Bipolaricaulota bacterium]
MEFRKVKPTKASTAVAEQILQAIKNGAFPVEGKLPSEAELAQQMGVSRPTVREALSALAAVGLIEARPGIGNFVKHPSESMALEALFILENEASCLEIMEARTVLEPPVAELAARKRSETHVDKLESLAHELAGLTSLDRFTEYFDTDKRFHLALVEAAQNNLLAAVLVPLINTMDQHLYREFTREYYLKDEGSIAEVASLHAEIAQAVRAQRPAQAGAAMRNHWQRMWRLVQGEEPN